MPIHDNKSLCIGSSQLINHLFDSILNSIVHSYLGGTDNCVESWTQFLTHCLFRCETTLDHEVLMHSLQVHIYISTLAVSQMHLDKRGTKSLRGIQHVYHCLLKAHFQVMRRIGGPINVNNVVCSYNEIFMHRSLYHGSKRFIGNWQKPKVEGKLDNNIFFLLLSIINICK